MSQIVIAFSNEETQQRLKRLLESNDCIPAGCFFSGSDVIRCVHKLGSACVICGFLLRDMTANDLALSLRGSAVLLAVTKPVYLDLCEGENLFKLATPVSRSDLFTSLNLLQQFEEKNLRRPTSHRKADEQKLIGRAKELLMEINRMSENEAHRFLQKRSMDSGLRMAETAQLIIQSYSQCG